VSQPRNPVWPMTPVLLDVIWEGLQKSERPLLGSSEKPQREPTGYRAALVMRLATEALRKPSFGDAVFFLRSYTGQQLVELQLAAPLEFNRLRLSAILAPLSSIGVPRFPGRPRGPEVATLVRVWVVDALAELCGFSESQAIAAWDKDFPKLAISPKAKEDGDAKEDRKAARARFRADRKRVRAMLTRTTPPKRGRGRPRKHERPGQLDLPDLGI
jgi:hypothetical protein